MIKKAIAAQLLLSMPVPLCANLFCIVCGEQVKKNFCNR